MENPEQFLRSSGLLFHINRALLHPLGLSLSLDVEESPASGTKCSFQLHETDDPIGFVFSEEEMKNSLSKYEVFISERKQRVMKRAKTLGFIMQTMK